MGRSTTAIEKYRAAVLRVCIGSGGLTLLLLSIPLAFGLFYCSRDLSLINLGNLCAIKNALGEGGGLWLSPHMGNGSPLLLRPSAQLFYPLRWLVLALPVDWAASLEQILHLALAAAATSWLAFTFRARPISAFCAGVVLAFSGTALDLLTHTSYFTLGAAYLPLVWAGARRALHPRGSARHVLAAGGGLAALLLGGEPQAFGIAVAIVLWEVALDCWRHRRAPRRRALILLGLIPAGLLSGAVLWIGYLVEAQLGPRGEALSLEHALRWSFDSGLWPAALWPGAVFAEPLPFASLWRLVQLGPGAGSVWNPAPYLGLVTLASVAVGLAARQARSASVVMLSGLVLALGSALPVLPLLLELVPPLRLFRYPQKYLLVTTLAAAVVATLACQRIARNAAARRRFVVVGLAIMATQGLLLIGLISGAKALDQIASFEVADLMRSDQTSFSRLLVNALLQASAALGSALLLCLARYRWRRWLALIIAVELILAAAPRLLIGPALADLPSPLPAAMARDGDPEPVFCSVYNLQTLNFGRPGDSAAWNSTAMRWMHAEPELNACHGMRAAVPYGPLRATGTWIYYSALNVYRARGARALGCTHLLSDLPIDEPDVVEEVPLVSGARPELAAARPRLYRVRSPVPLAFVARDPTRVDDVREAAALALSAGDAPGLLAVVDDPLGRLGSAQLPLGRGVGGAEVRWKSASEGLLELGGKGAAVAGVRRPFLVGWTARQGGQSVPVVRVGGQHLGVVVEDAARGAVELRYQSPRFGPSAVASCCGLAALLGLALLTRGRRARSEVESGAAARRRDEDG